MSTSVMSLATTAAKVRRRRKASGLTPVLLAAAAAAALAMGAGAARAEDKPAAATVSEAQVKAKMAYCEVCHGPSARGFVGYYPIPRLAGQQVAYLENQLRGFIARKRANPIMTNVAHTLSPAMLKALAERFHELNPPPAGRGPKDQVAAGKEIYNQGISKANIPPCASCHGPDAKGNDQFPRLAGQLYPYVVTQLTNWSKERAEKNSDIMAPIAHSLSKTQVQAVAAYVSNLE